MRVSHIVTFRSNLGRMGEHNVITRVRGVFYFALILLSQLLGILFPAHGHRFQDSNFYRIPVIVRNHLEQSTTPSTEHDNGILCSAILTAPNVTFTTIEERTNLMIGRTGPFRRFRDAMTLSAAINAATEADALPHEVQSMARFAEALPNEQFYLVSQVDNQDVPGFDGFITTHSNETVNFSLKTITSKQRRSVFRHITQALVQALRFSHYKQWHSQWLEESIPINIRLRRQTWVVKSFKLFGGFARLHNQFYQTGRRIRVLIDLGTQPISITHSDIQALQQFVNDMSQEVEGIVFLHGTGTLLHIKSNI